MGSCLSKKTPDATVEDNTCCNNCTITDKCPSSCCIFYLNSKERSILRINKKLEEFKKKHPNMDLTISPSSNR